MFLHMSAILSTGMRGVYPSMHLGRGVCIPASTWARGCIPACTWTEGYIPVCIWVGVYTSLYTTHSSMLHIPSIPHTHPSIEHPLPVTATEADGTHPTGMHVCSFVARTCPQKRPNPNETLDLRMCNVVVRQRNVFTMKSSQVVLNNQQFWNSPRQWQKIQYFLLVLTVDSEIWSRKKSSSLPSANKVVGR